MRKAEERGLTMASFDGIVVGSGVAGSTTAALLAQQGFRVLLVEKATFPREKICGEGLMPAGASILNELGILSQLRGAQAFSGIHFHLPRDRCLALNFGEVSQTTQGWVVPRMVLDESLARFAAQQPGIQLREGFRVLSAQTGPKQVEITGLYQGKLQTHRARLLIGADGIRSRFHHGFGIHRLKRRARRFALRTFYDQLEGSDRVEVHCCEAGEAYVAPMDNGAARITLLLFGSAQRTRGAALSDLYFEKLSLFPRLVQRLKNPYPQGPVQSTGAVSLEVSRCHGQRLLLVGDAAGAVDPVTGQGMTVALKNAQLACQVLKERLHKDSLSEQDLGEYTRLRNGYFRPSFQLAQMLLCAVRYLFVGRQTFKALSRNQTLRKKVLRMVAL
jgi:2-polyprenyl-6-methoxyphenol hydroxylase-like FAD-dependent oxidoreductase